ncbi:MAG: 2-octaprenyl-6-methoxyphenyl hydroxylase [Pseudohongiellaceae bacterium]|nr:2-octaprenyl-6-methoxyphenyl hydroxylase [Pseudohongiellaceae bacterium]
MRAKQIKPLYDVVVVGGGLVGASFACALAKQSSELSILVIEAVEHLASSTSFDARSTALSYGSRRIYSQLGLWDGLAEAVTPIKKIHVSDRGHFGAVRLNHEELGVDALGYVAENHDLGRVLNQALEDSNTIEFLRPARISDMQPIAAGMRLQLEGEQLARNEIDAALLVLADGGKSKLSQKLGIHSQTKPYGQKAIISNIAFENPHNNIAYERFTDSGPLAVLPLATLEGENRAALIWTVPEQQADETLALSDEAFLHALQQRFGHRLGRLEKVGARFAYPLSLTVAQEQVRPGLVLLGNVAHTLHPVAGQGLNLALRDSQCLAELLAAANAQGKALGDMAVLQNYVNAQERDQAHTIDFSHYMTALFSSSQPALVWARKLGLFSVDLIPPLKQEFAKVAMGLGDRRSVVSV